MKMYEKGTESDGLASGEIRHVGMGRRTPTAINPPDLRFPEIGAAMNNLENEVAVLIEESERLVSMLDGVLRPEGTQKSGDAAPSNPLESKAPIAEHADRISMSVRGYRTRITRLIERVAL